MIDSLNLIIKIRYINFEYLKDLGIEIRYFSDFNIKFKYKNIEFKYNTLRHYLLILANPHKVLNKRDILISDKEEYKNKIHKIIREVIPTQKINIEVNRNDYCVDIQVGERIWEYCKILNKHSKEFYYMKQTNKYATSKYLTNKRGQRHLNFYNRFAKTLNKEDNGILRLEIQNNPQKIKREYEKNQIPKTIDYYWSIEAMEQYYFDVLKSYLFTGDYFKRNLCKKIIDNSNEKSLNKKRLNKFLLMESRYGIDGIVKNKMFSYDTKRKYIQILNRLNINPITIPNNFKYDYLENLLKLAKKTANEKYFK